jgi:hypothetical protein
MQRALGRESDRTVSLPACGAVCACWKVYHRVKVWEWFAESNGRTSRRLRDVPFATRISIDKYLACPAVSGCLIAGKVLESVRISFTAAGSS